MVVLGNLDIIFGLELEYVVWYGINYKNYVWIVSGQKPRTAQPCSESIQVWILEFFDIIRTTYVKATIQSYTYFLGSIVPQQNELFPAKKLLLFSSRGEVPTYLVPTLWLPPILDHSYLSRYTDVLGMKLLW